jgi:hypothetical protein
MVLGDLIRSARTSHLPGDVPPIGTADRTR